MDSRTRASESLRRSSTDRVLAGVIGGVGQRLSLPPNLLRVGAVVLATALGGIPLLAYGLAALLMVADDATVSVLDQWTRSNSKLALPALIAVGLVITAAVSSLDLSAPIKLATASVLIAAGGYLVSGRHDHALASARPRGAPAPGTEPTASSTVGNDAPTSLARPEDGSSEFGSPHIAPPRPASGPGASTSPSMSPAQPSTRGIPGRAPLGAGPQPPAPSRPAALPPPTPPVGPSVVSNAVAYTREQPAEPSRPRSRLSLAFLGIACLVVSGEVALDAIGIPGITFSLVMASVLMVLGAGLAVATVRGRGRLLIMVGLVVLPSLLVTAAPNVTELGLGHVEFSPAVIAGDVDYDVVAGTLTLDLAETVVRSEPTGPPRVKIRIGAGQARVLLSEDREVQIQSRTSAGQIDLYGEVVSGEDIRLDRTDPAPTLVLDIEVLAGSIAVTRVS